MELMLCCRFDTQRGGVASFEDIVTAVRAESRRRQRLQAAPGSAPAVPASYNTTMDRRTIARTVGLMEHPLQRIYTRQFTPDSLAGTGSASGAAEELLLVLCECADKEQELVAEYFARQAAEQEPSVLSPTASAPPKLRPGRKPGSTRKRARKAVDSGTSGSDEGSDSEGGESSDASAADGQVSDADAANTGTGAGMGPSGQNDVKYRQWVRMRALKLRKLNDDPALFDYRLALPADPSAQSHAALGQVAGQLIAALCLHFHLLELSPALEESAGGGIVTDGFGPAPETAPYTFDRITPYLPFEYYFKTSDSLRHALTEAASGDEGNVVPFDELSVVPVTR
jgi:hypothetical protein